MLRLIGVFFHTLSSGIYLNADRFNPTHRRRRFVSFRLILIPSRCYSCVIGSYKFCEKHFSLKNVFFSLWLLLWKLYIVKTIKEKKIPFKVDQLLCISNKGRRASKCTCCIRYRCVLHDATSVWGVWLWGQWYPTRRCCKGADHLPKVITQFFFTQLSTQSILQSRQVLNKLVHKTALADLDWQVFVCQ